MPSFGQQVSACGLKRRFPRNFIAAERLFRLASSASRPLPILRRVGNVVKWHRVSS